ncbi:unnamed protein product [Adineta steineri]|uniref:Uncharacterized protein n=1 Tax=Adineta steineri TaxID=433720 RepID=A0A814LWS4_9BILA|nr:unnamed protein product [Adineta steineri]
MLAASQEIDSFIERQRSKLNKQPLQQPINRQTTFQQPAYQPPPRQQTFQSNDIQDRLDFKVARILDEPPPRVQQQQQQQYYPPSSPPPPMNNNNNLSAEQQRQYFSEQQQRRPSNDNTENNSASFFNRFGTYDDKRTQLKDDLKREYNEYLQAQRGLPKSKSSSQLISPRNNITKHVQFQQQQQQQNNNKVVAPWEKNEKRSVSNIQNTNNMSSTLTSNEYTVNRSRTNTSNNHDEQYIRDREEYVLELHSQIRELESKRKQLEIDASRLSAGGSSMVTRAHYNEDLSALNSLLAERLDQRNSIDHELARILNRPPVSSSPTRGITGGVSNLNLISDQSQQISSQGYQQQQQQHGRHVQQYRNENRSGTNDNGFTIGQEVDKDAEQAAKKRYQQELQAQMREAQMRKAQAKQDKDEYDRKIDAEIQNYSYFGRSGGGGGAPMRDKDGNVVANLADVRNPPPPTQRQPPPPQQQQPYYPTDDKVYSLGNGLSSISNPPFYNGEPQQQFSSNSDRPGSPNHARGAVSNGMFGTAKTEAQFVKEEKYKQDLKQQMEDKRRRDAEETAKRRAEEERELAKHLEWQQQMEKQVAEEAIRKQQKEEEERLHQLQLQEDVEQRKKQDELISKRKPKRQDKPSSPRIDDDTANRKNTSNEQPLRSEVAYRSASPPVPTLNKKDKKKKPTTNNTRRPSFDDANQQPSLPSFDNHDDYIQQPPPVDDTDGHGRQTYRKPPTPRQPDISASHKPPQTYRARPRQNSNAGMPVRNSSAASLRSDGSDSEVLNRLEHLKQQLRDRERKLQDHVNRHQTDQPKTQSKQHPGFVLNTPRVHHRDSPTTNDVVRRILQTDDDAEFNPSYFRDDTILLGGAGGNHANNDDKFFSSIIKERMNSGNRKFTDEIEQASRHPYNNNNNHNPSKYYDHEDPTSMANYELNRIAKQNEQRLKKLRDLENDDASLLDSNEVLERFQQKQRIQRGGSQTTLQDDAWLK